MKLSSRRILLFVVLLFASVLVNAQTQAQFNWNDLGFSNQKLTANYWIARAKNPDSVLLTAQHVADSNQRLAKIDTSVSDRKNWPARFSASQIADKINALSKRPSRVLFSQDGKQLSESDIDALLDNLNLEAIQPSNNEQFGLITQRSALRTFPSDLRAFSAIADTDIDRFQESALFPGAPVAVLHQSRDSKWLFVQSELYAAWVKADAVAMASRETVLAYSNKTPRLVITGADVRTAFSPNAPEVSGLALDMGISVPVRKDWPSTMPVNGQGTLASHVIELPVRNGLGLLHIVPVLVARAADTQQEYLSATKANIIRQSFKFMGERYGWGHDYGTRDCSGFVSEVYRSMGIILPRNTGDQAKSQAFDRESFDAMLSHEQRIKQLKQLRIGDLIYIPGHVMLVIGKDAFGPWVIHDSHATGFIQNGFFYAIPTNGVAVTPLLSMALGTNKTYIDSITAVQHIIPRHKP